MRPVEDYESELTGRKAEKENGHMTQLIIIGAIVCIGCALWVVT